MEEKKSLDALQKIAAIIIGLSSILVVCIPVAGFIYDLGYISVFGLDANIFPRALSDFWQHSFRVSLELGVSLLKQLRPVLDYIAYAFFAIVFVFIFVSIPGNKKKIKNFINKDLKFPYAEEIKLTYGLLSKFYLNPKYLLYLFLGIVLFVGLFYSLTKPIDMGIEDAKNVMAKYKESGCVSETWSRCVSYANPNAPSTKAYKGLLVAASSTHLAIFDGSSVEVIPRISDYVLTRQLTQKTSP